MELRGWHSPRPAARGPSKPEELKEVLEQPVPEQTDELEEVARLLGCRPSQVAQLAARVMQHAGVYRVLCPACGSGECSAFLASRGFRVTAYDSSEMAVTCVSRRAERLGARVECFVDDVVMPRRTDGKYDAIYSHNVLHQLRASQRRQLLRSFWRALRRGGVVVLSALSTEDDRYGYGRQVESDTFESGMGETLHFYSPSDLHEEMSEFFDVARVEQMEEVYVSFGGEQRYHLVVAIGLRAE